MKILNLLLILSLFSCVRPSGHKIKTSTLIKESQNSDSIKIEKEVDWIASFPQNIKSIQDSFLRNNVKDYDCKIIDGFLYDAGTKLDTKSLSQIDSSIFMSLFGNANSNLINFHNSFLYSIEKPFMHFFPITVISFGVVKRPLILVMFDSVGNYVNSIEVADSYGEEGGCLYSAFINDSVMTQMYSWDGIVEDSLGNNKRESIFRKQNVIFKEDGTYRIIEISPKN